MKPETTIEGVLERIVYSNEENAWSVVRLMVRGRGQVTAVGNLLGVQPGESLRLTGRWHSDRKYGEQFKVASYLTIKPSTFVGIEKYLSSGLVKGIGPEMARRLVQHFGLDTLEVIDHEPGRLTEVGGIGPVRSARIREAWREQSEIREVVIFLQSHGVSTAHAVKIYKQYGADAVAVVRRNPYCLAREVYGIGFATADKIARDLGIPADSPERAAAGALYALNQAADDGHMYLDRRKLLEEAASLLDVEAEVVDPAVTALIENGELAAVEVPPEGDKWRSPELAQQAIYLAPLEAAERGAAELLKALTAQQLLPLSIDVARAIGWFEEREKIELAPEQGRALERAIASKVMVLTGGPGTGKTMLMRGIVNIMTAKGLRVELAAPTGRAAKRLSEATGFEARTVHRLLEFNPNKGGFVRGPDNPLEIDLLVVDEASMLDTVLSYHILKAMPREARLILVGDIDQLPSVGPGRVLADLIESQALEVVRLTEIFRQAQESLIVVNAHRVRVGELPKLLPVEDGDFFFIERSEPEATLATIKHLVAERIPRSFGFDSWEAIQVLTPMQRGLLGAGNLNAELQELLNPRGEAVTRGSRLLRAGDRVMQLRNNYDLEVFNGDIGRIEMIDIEEQRVRVGFDGRGVEYDFSELDELTLSYACSIHKSQGSEYPCVVIPLHTQHYMMLQRNLLYTAITRGSRLVVIVGSRRALALATKTETSTRRATLLGRRLRPGGLEGSGG